MTLSVKAQLESNATAIEDTIQLYRWWAALAANEGDKEKADQINGRADNLEEDAALLRECAANVEAA